MIAILDYGAGNLRSVENTLAAIGATYTLVRDSAGLRAASKIILPGVGHYGQMMRAHHLAVVADAGEDDFRSGAQTGGVAHQRVSGTNSSERIFD